MLKIAMAVLAMVCALGTIPTAAAAQNACEFYRVKKGDSLREITERAYGDKKFRRIYRANAAEIGRNPNVIEIGMVLKLPCLDGSMPEDDRTAAASGSPGGEDVVSFVTANGYLPYTDESLGNRGMFTHLVSTAMVRAAPDAAFEVVFVNDWSAHLETLLPRNAFDASFPWTRPGCETQGELTPIELYSCQNYLYSDPFYEIVDGFFSRTDAGLENVIDASGFEGLTICRPEGYPTGHLEEMGLMPPEVTLIQPVGAYACFRQLVAGNADLVALDTRAGERAMNELRLTDRVVENRHLFSIQPLRVALHKDNPKSEALIADLNEGLKIMLGSGEWSAIVTETLQEQAMSLTN